MASNFELRQATENDTGIIRDLIHATPQDGDLLINFEREPNFFDGTKVTTSKPDVWLYYDNIKKQLGGVFSFGSREVYVNGARKQIRYANDLRIHSDYRGSRSLLRMFNQVKKQLNDREWMQTVILSDNQASLSTVGSGRAGLPTYYPYGKVATHMLYVSGKKPEINNGINIRLAKPDDINAMQRFFNKEAPKKQFYPHYEFNNLKTEDSYYNNLSIENYFLAFNGSEIVGICGFWNQKEFKQTRFLEYRGKMRLLRQVNNVYSKLFGGIQLPKPGDTLDYISLHTILVKNNNPGIFSSLLRRAYNHFCSQPISAIVTGLSIDDPLSEVYKKYRKQTIYSNHFLMSYEEDPRETLDREKTLYLEISRA
ncbi:hypothetical protein [Pleionea sediminis]|uniref:hypothetical protein n=1 Tax=Pleionea sediminis TaxID=2569479 RepID=UPI001185AE6C|nr:hypothetical protein [Pleionea sediminis]